jgi:cobalt/nickel transport protein
MSKGKLTIVLLLLCVVIMIVPFALNAGSDADFGGADDKASEAINDITGTEYEPWFTPVIENFFPGGELPSETESLLFCLQAALGAGVFCFLLGRLLERSKWNNKLTEMGMNPETLQKKS